MDSDSNPAWARKAAMPSEQCASHERARGGERPFRQCARETDWQAALEVVVQTVGPPRSRRQVKRAT
eukprot:6214368-Pleurochrysis_carterae.AAC.5